MNDKDIDSEEFIEELISCGELPFKLNAYQAYICVCLFQLALKHPDLKPEDATYKTGNTIARFLHGELAKRSTLVGEVLEEGWDEYFMLDIQFEEETPTAANFCELISPRQYQLALLAKANELLCEAMAQAVNKPKEEVKNEVDIDAALFLNADRERLVSAIIKELDENVILD